MLVLDRTDRAKVQPDLTADRHREDPPLTALGHMWDGEESGEHGRDGQARGTGSSSTIMGHGVNQGATGKGTD